MNRIKNALICSCLVVIIAVQSIEHSFYQKPKLTKWRELTWNDFNGIPTPFSNWAAVIYSDIILEYEEDHFRAYAVQNNLKSWTKKNTIASDYALEHEQYHFNITEIYARKLNRFLAENPNLSEPEIRAERNKIRLELNTEQDKYDGETDHGLKVSTQHLWEYRIDSILKESVEEKKYWTDILSGVSLPIRNTPTTTTGFLDSTALYQLSTFEKYGLEFTVTSMQYDNFDFDRIPVDIKSNYESKNFYVEYLQQIPGSYDHRYRIIARNNSVGQVKYEEWIGHYPFVNVLSINLNYKASQFNFDYYKLSTNLLESFQLESRDSTLINSSIDFNNPSISYGSLDNYDSIAVANADESCLVFQTDSPQGIFGLPIKTGSDSVLIPYKVVGVADSLIEEKILIAYENTYSDTSPGPNVLFRVPFIDLKEDTFWAYIGYTLKQDSTNECYRVFGQNVILTKPESNRP